MKKRLLALVLAVAMLLSMSVAVSAIEIEYHDVIFAFNYSNTNYSTTYTTTGTSYTLPTQEDVTAAGDTGTLLGWTVTLDTNNGLYITSSTAGEYYAPGTTITYTTTRTQTYADTDTFNITAVWDESTDEGEGDTTNEVTAYIAFYDSYEEMCADQDKDDTGTGEYTFENSIFEDTFTLTFTEEPLYVGSYTLPTESELESYGVELYGREFSAYWTYPVLGWCDKGDGANPCSFGEEITYTNNLEGHFPIVRVWAEFAELTTSETDYDVSVKYEVNGTDITDALVTYDEEYGYSYTSFTVNAGETTGEIDLAGENDITDAGITLPNGEILVGWDLTTNYGKFFDYVGSYDTIAAASTADWRTTTEALPEDGVVITATAIFEPATVVTVEIDNTSGAIPNDIMERVYDDLSSNGDAYYNDPDNAECMADITWPTASAPTNYGDELSMKIVSGWNISKILNENDEEINLSTVSVEFIDYDGEVVGTDINQTYAAAEGMSAWIKLPTDSMAYTVVLVPTVEDYVEEIAEWEITVNVYESDEDMENGEIFKTLTTTGTNSEPIFNIFSNLEQSDLGLTTDGELEAWDFTIKYSLDDGAETGAAYPWGGISSLPQTLEVTMAGHTKGVFTIDTYPDWAVEGTLTDVGDNSGEGEGDDNTGDDTPTDAPIASEEGNVIVKIEDTTDVPKEGSSETDDPDVETIYSVEIIWGDLTFEWKAPKVWDPETHTYVDAESGEEWTISNNDTLKNGDGDEILDADGNALRHDSVVVYNHSNARLNAEFTLTNTDTTVTASIDQSTVEVGAAIINNVYDDAARVIATVSLSDDNKADFADWFSGHEDAGNETVTIATVTVTITKVAE